MSDCEPQARPEVERQRPVPNRPDVLVAGQVVELRIDRRPLLHLVTAAQIDLCVCKIKIAVRQQQGVITRQAAEGRDECGIIAPAGKTALHLDKPFRRRIGDAHKAEMRRPTEGPRTDKRRIGAKLYTGKEWVLLRADRCSDQVPSIPFNILLNLDFMALFRV